MSELRNKWEQLTGKLNPVYLKFTGAIVVAASCLVAAAVIAEPKPANPPAAVLAAYQSDEHPEFPAGEGRDVTLRVCSRCHSPNNILSRPQSREGWEATLAKMVDMGATASDEDFAKILDYVSKNFPAPGAGGATAHVNVNKAAAADLVKGLGLTEKEAAALVDYRTKNGDFKALSDLKKVPDVDGSKIDDKKDIIEF
ncbi:ComEA family DNA-binding protein [Terriglobus tenax]|uniref:ComEA family DNA-binding protein n=1 Tax=Terriglobus tenax TaxID=1111115 RepID=UPI0021E08C9A|nr:helix-hairpin-helix domain-containing protein [Terriglobus tenax]